jgi:hypothetical protein
MRSAKSYPSNTAASAPAAPPKLLDRVRERIRRKGYSLRTETAYARWIKRFILFHGKRHPRDLGAVWLPDALARKYPNAAPPPRGREDAAAGPLDRI